MITQRWRTVVVLLALVCIPLALGCSTTARANGGLYIALGDSLSAGIGASDPDATAFVPLVHESLGKDVELLNLGHSGDTSHQLIDHGHLDQAVAEIEQRNNDDERSNDVRLVTLEIGGNDLLQLYFSLVQTGACPDVTASLSKQQCIDALKSVFSQFEPNLVAILDRLRDADPQLPVLLLTLYNAFEHVPGVGELGALSLEGKAGSPFPQGLNTIIRAVAEGRDDVTVVDIYPLFQGRSQELVSGDQIHPNDLGYQVMADAVIAVTAN